MKEHFDHLRVEGITPKLENRFSLSLFFSHPAENIRKRWIHVKPFTGFPGGSVVKKLPANARDVGLIPDPGRYHTQGSN